MVAPRHRGSPSAPLIPADGMNGSRSLINTANWTHIRRPELSGTRLTICALTRPTVVNQRMVRRQAAFIVWAAVCETLVHGQASTHDTQSTPRRLTKIINSYPAPLPDGSRVVFQSNRSGVFQIYSMKADGSDVRQLTNMPDDRYCPSYSRDGKLIAFAHGSGGKSDVCIMASDGSAAHQLTRDGLDNSHPHWSPDGRRILFNSSRTTPPGNRADRTKEKDDVFSVALDGADLRQHTRCNTICTFAFFSPDMKRIVYRKVTNTPGLNWDLSESKRNSEIAVANADGSDETVLTNHELWEAKAACEASQSEVSTRTALLMSGLRTPPQL